MDLTLTLLPALPWIPANQFLNQTQLSGAPVMHSTTPPSFTQPSLPLRSRNENQQVGLNAFRMAGYQWTMLYSPMPAHADSLTGALDVRSAKKCRYNYMILVKQHG